jgi:hypothetical protein
MEKIEVQNFITTKHTEVTNDNNKNAYTLGDY